MAELDGVFLKEIVDHGLREFPNECCGLVAAKDGVPVRVYAMRNLDASPVSYRLDPKEQLRVFDEMDAEGLELWAIYHSHTHSRAYPSETDVAEARNPECVYVIMSLSDRENPVVRGFRIEDGEVDEEELVIA